MSHRATKATLRFLGSVAAVSGLLLVVEAAVTVVWQEPVSALVAARAQAELDEDLEELSRDEAWERIAEVGGSKQEVLSRLARWHAAHSEAEAVLGRLELPALGSSHSVVEGISRAALRRGPGHYEDTELPGQGGTFAVAGHRTTYLAPFRDIDELEPNDRLIVKMPYAIFTYRLERTQIVEPDATWVKEVGDERLVLTACHPLYSAAKRIVAFAALDKVRVTPAVRQAWRAGGK